MVKNDLSERDLLVKAQNYCSLAEHCIAEVREKLYQWGASNEVRDKIIDSLLDNGFIDEKRYAAAFVHDKVAFQSWGREKIRMMLLMKHIASPVVEEAICNIDEKVYNKQLAHLIEQKRQELLDSSVHHSSIHHSKIARFLAQRGFTTEEIMSRIAEFTSPL